MLEASAHNRGCFIHFDRSSLHLACAELPVLVWSLPRKAAAPTLRMLGRQKGSEACGRWYPSIKASDIKQSPCAGLRKSQCCSMAGRASSHPSGAGIWSGDRALPILSSIPVADRTEAAQTWLQHFLPMAGAGEGLWHLLCLSGS